MMIDKTLQSMDCSTTDHPMIPIDVAVKLPADTPSWIIL